MYTYKVFLKGECLVEINYTRRLKKSEIVKLLPRAALTKAKQAKAGLYISFEYDMPGTVRF